MWAVWIYGHFFSENPSKAIGCSVDDKRQGTDLWAEATKCLPGFCQLLAQASCVQLRATRPMASLVQLCVGLGDEPL